METKNLVDIVRNSLILSLQTTKLLEYALEKLRTILCFIFSIALYSSVQAQIGSLCHNIIYQIIDDSEKYDYEFFYRTIKVMPFDTIADERDGEFLFQFGHDTIKIVNKDAIIRREKAYIGESPDKRLGKYVRWRNRKCRNKLPIKGYLVITEKTTKLQQIISFPILDEVDAYWFKGCGFKKGAYKIIKYNYPDLYYSDNDLVPCENDLPQVILKLCQNYSINKTKKTRKHTIQERQP